jgi:hypothetical protein
LSSLQNLYSNIGVLRDRALCPTQESRLNG